jgi:membrane protease subunit HflC
MKIIAALIVILVVLAAVIGPQALFTVDETQLAIVTRFGEFQRAYDDPGLGVKTPFIEQVIYLDKRLLVFDAPPNSLLTKDKKRLIIDVYARGRISDPRKFIEEVATQREGANRAIEIISSELRREIGLDDQSEIIKTSRESIMNKVRDAVSPKLEEFGIEVVDLRIKRADFPSQIAASVHLRMQAERKRKADKFRAEGAQTDLEVRADVDKQATIIRSAAQRDADIIRGCGEAEAISIFAGALEQDPEFYMFQRSLELYKTYLTQNTTIVGSATDLGRMFEEIRQAVTSAAASPEAPAGGRVPGSGLEVLESRCEQIEAEIAARRFLAGQLVVSESALIMKESEKTEWPDASLGCPEEDQFYAQVIVPGYNVSFEYEGASYPVHTNSDGSQVVTCGP